MFFTIAAVFLAVTPAFSRSMIPIDRVTLCGTVQVVSTRGFPPTVTTTLNVPAGEMLPAFSTYTLVTGGRDSLAFEKRKAIIDSLLNGDRACIEGIRYHDQDYHDLFVPDNVVSLFHRQNRQY